MRATTLMFRYPGISIVFCIALFAACGPARGESPADAGVPAFPGAEGAGAITRGGRGGEVLIVTNLDDSGPGSLRAAVEARGPRTVVFRVAGLITLETPLAIEHPFITIAGQTAPGDGVCVRGQSVHINTHDVVIRYMRFRRGNLKVRDDALGGNPVGNVIIDHVSASWGLDENLSLYRHMVPVEGRPAKKLPVENLTIQWSISSEALDRNQPRLRRDLGRQGLLVPSQPLRLQHGPQPEHRHGRAVRLPQQRAVQLAAPDHRRRRRELAGQHRHQLLQARPGDDGWTPPPPHLQDRHPALRNTSSPASASGMSTATSSRGARRSRPITGPAGAVQRGAEDQGRDRPHGDGGGRRGPRSPSRRAPSASSRPEKRTSSCSPTPARPSPAATPSTFASSNPSAPAGHLPGWDHRFPGRRGRLAEYESAPVPTDADADGMPDDWEARHGLDPNDSADSKTDEDGDGYTSIEEYLNGTDPTAFVDYRKAGEQSECIASSGGGTGVSR